MNVKRMFTTADVKGNRDYLKTQKKYEIMRTILFFLISASLYIAGIVTTGNKINLLTIVAVLGCLPACKSLVETIMYMRFHSLPAAQADVIERCTKDLTVSYDLVFTTYDKNYNVEHVAIRGNTVVCFTSNEKLDETACTKHLTDRLKMDGLKSVSIKIFKDINKYTERLAQLPALSADPETETCINNTLRSIAL